MVKQFSLSYRIPTKCHHNISLNCHLIQEDLTSGSTSLASMQAETHSRRFDEGVPVIRGRLTGGFLNLRARPQPSSLLSGLALHSGIWLKG